MDRNLNKDRMMKKRKLIPLIIVAGLVVVLLGYEGWNAARPQKSCASCHEISPSVETNMTSAHRNIKCSQCHGTALSNGIHSVREKVNMLFTHIGESKQNEEIRMSEAQIVEIMNRCEGCHRTQFADWKSGGHSVTYQRIFMNETHNKMEKPYWDCFRCHGMYYEGNITTLMEPLDNVGPWHFKDPKQADVPVIPCLACHEIHSENTTRVPAAKYEDPSKLFYERDARNIPFGLFLRADQMFLRADYFTPPPMYHNGVEVDAPSDLDYRLCVQCHSPDWRHETGTQDDRTPIGVHEGLTCNSCHKPHSNDPRGSCSECHPAISNCNLDVTTMNTTYASADSPHNIHSVACADCHPGKY